VEQAEEHGGDQLGAGSLGGRWCDRLQIIGAVLIGVVGVGIVVAIVQGVTVRSPVLRLPVNPPGFAEPGPDWRERLSVAAAGATNAMALTLVFALVLVLLGEILGVYDAHDRPRVASTSVVIALAFS